MRLGNYDALWLLWVLPILGAVYGYGFWRRTRSLRRFAQPDLIGRINSSTSITGQVLKAVLLVLAAASIVVALTEPGWNPHTEKVRRKGRDIVVLLDVSRSMLAEDIKPNRLERAKLAVQDLMDKLAGDRIGIVAFAGSATIKCPLTQDYAFARLALSGIGTDSVGRGGTLIGDAIRKATSDVFDQQERNYRDMILITDGEDHGSFALEAAQDAAAQGVNLFVIGLGSEDEGARIPIGKKPGQKEFLKYKGEEQWSRLDSKGLRQIALATPGARYLNVATDTFNLDDVYTEAIATAEKKLLESTTTVKYDEKFQVFLALALVLIVTEAAISERKRGEH